MIRSLMVAARQVGPNQPPVEFHLIPLVGPRNESAYPVRHFQDVKSRNHLASENPFPDFFLSARLDCGEPYFPDLPMMGLSAMRNTLRKLHVSAIYLPRRRRQPAFRFTTRPSLNT
jgi:hypothetical protein